MVKVRSKMKKKVGGKKWSHASTSVPTISKHRANAKSRFFRPNLSLKPADNEKPSGLTMEAVLKHEAIQNYSGHKDPTVNDIAHSLKSFSMSGVGSAISDGDEMMTESNLGSFKTFKTFASNFSACTNMSFSKFLNHFRSDSEQHKEMLAILAALTEVIKERGGSQTSTEYFLALMETIDNSKDANDTVAAVSLLAMGIKTVPQAILRKKFSDVGQILLDLMERFVDSDNINILRSIIGCLSVLLRAQEYSQWQMPKTLHFFDTILTFVTHTKPRIRKAAQHAVVSILFGSSFMVPPKRQEEGEVPAPAPVKLHPASGRVAKFCVGQFKPENVANNQTVVLHTLGLLQSAMSGFVKDDIKSVSEQLLSIMTSTNLLIRTTCFQTFHHLFQSRTANLTAPLTGKLIAALYEYRPDKTDTQTLAWLTVLKEAHIFLATVNRQMCSSALPKFVEVCCTDLWLSDKVEIINGASNVLRELFTECVRPCCETTEEAAKHRVSIDKVLECVGKTLSAPFGPATKHILSLYAVIFEVCGRQFGKTLAPALATLGRRYDPESSNRLQIEHTVSAAIATVDTKIVLTQIPLHEPSGEMSINRSWLLPLLRQCLNGSSLELFNNYVLKLAYACYTKWQKLKELNNVTQSHLNELLCCQLWGLFPGFCRRPRDIGNFKLLAKTLGTVLNENPDLRAPILDGFLELIANLETDDEKHEVGKFAKNFLPRLFNIYTTKPKGSYENEIRQQAFEVIRVYLAITPPAVLREMFTTALEQFGGKSPGTFLHDMLFDIVETLALYQPKEVLDDLYEQFIVKIFAKEKSKMEEKGKVDFNVRRQLKKAYKLLLNILDADKPACLEFIAEKLHVIEELLLGAVDTTFEATQALRLSCLKQLLLKQPELNTQTNLLHQVIPEVVLAFSNETVKKENTATDMIRIIGDTFEQEQKLNEFVDVLLMGFVGDTVIVTNTIWVLKDLVAELTGNLTVDSVKFIIEQVVAFVTSNNRKEAEASVTFLVTFTKVLPAPLVANHLELIVKALSAMTSDTKRHLRILLGFLLKKLCNKFGADEIVRLVPGNDEQTHKRLRKIRKEMSRAKRNRDGKKKGDRGAEGDSDDEDLDAGLEKKSVTIDDILADSDSDISDAESDGGKEKIRTNMDTYIREDPDMIVDLADVDVMNKITSSQPGKADTTTDADGRKKVKKPNRGFKTAADGRIIIKMDERHSDEDDSADEIEGFADKAKKRVYDESDESDAADEDVPEGSSRKKKAVEGSMKSGWSGGASSKYAPGGKGIHRPVAQSVKSGYSKGTARTATTVAGSEYSSRKAKGDMKKKGKLEPYAYIPLSRNSLNRRKRAKNTTQFKSIVEGARKGAAAGAKNRMVEKAKSKKRGK